MYKWVLTHEVLPGKLQDMRSWFMQQDEERKKSSPNYPRVKRYTTVFGSVHRVTTEVESAAVPEAFLERGYAGHAATGAQGDFLQLIVPGSTTLSLWKNLM